MTCLKAGVNRFVNIVLALCFYVLDFDVGSADNLLASPSPVLVFYTHAFLGCAFCLVVRTYLLIVIYRLSAVSFLLG